MVTQAREKIEAGVRRLGFHVLGQPQLGIVSFAHADANALSLFAKMHHRGWFTAALVDPPALHLMLSPQAPRCRRPVPRRTRRVARRRRSRRETRGELLGLTNCLRRLRGGGSRVGW